jgi:LysM repeat protein
MKKLILFLCVCASITVNAQKQKTEAYVESYKEIAITEMLRTGVPAAITLAQGILESQSGESDLVKNSNNHFGIKCKTEWTGERTYHDDDEKGECFRVYPSADESYKDHSDFLKSRPHYAFLFKLDPTDFEGWAKGLKKAGYATNPQYPQKLMKLINEYNLQQYSLDAIARRNNPSVSPAVDNTAAVTTVDHSFENKTITEAREMIQPKQETNTALETTAAVGNNINTETAKTTVKTANYPKGIFSINNTKVVYAVAGTSLLSLANQHDLTLSRLLEYNEMRDMDVLEADQLLFIEKKSKKGGSDFHTVSGGESLHDISQQEGVRFENLLEYNSLKKDARVSAGEKIYLRAVIPQASAGKAVKAKKMNGR